MEETMKWEQVKLISELRHGKELAEQLWNHLSSSSSTIGNNEFLIEKILSCYETALTMLKWGANVGETKTVTGNTMDSHCSFTDGNPRSEVFDQDFEHKDSSKKRKTMPRWTKQVKVSPGTGLEGSPADGHSWRKYGQKDILGAKFPRGYYRCTHRHVQGCLATKQVQRSDEDPTILEITYRGRHTCTQASNQKKAFPLKIKMGSGEKQFQNHIKNQPQEDILPEQNPEAFFSFGAKLEVKTEDLDTKEGIFPSFCFPSPSVGSENEDNIFTETMLENHFMESFSPPFMSPATSESNIFCLSTCHLGSTGLCQNVQTSESDVTDIVSAPTSATTSPMADLYLLLDKGDFDSDFPFNTPEFFSS